MQTLRQLKARIKSVENVKKLTRAMEMISSAKVKPLKIRIAGAERYNLSIEHVVNNLLASFDVTEYPYISKNNDGKNIKNEQKRKAVVCVLSSDTGMCGGYNQSIIKAAETFIKELKMDVSVFPVGKKAVKYFKRNGYRIKDSLMDMKGRFSGDNADMIGSKLVNYFTSKEADEIYVVYTHFESASRFRARIEKFLPMEPKKKGERIYYLIEPDVKMLLDELIPIYIKSKMRMVMLNSLVSEHSARVLAMGEATANATELMEALILQRNKKRQEGITKEIIEIISSADALRG